MAAMRIGDRVEVVSIPDTKIPPFEVGDQFHIEKVSKAKTYIRIGGGNWHWHKHFKVIHVNRPRRERGGRDVRMRNERGRPIDPDDV